MAVSIAACRHEAKQSSVDTTRVVVATPGPAAAGAAARDPVIDSILKDTTFVCIPDSTFRMGPVHIGDSAGTAISALGTPLSVVERGMDYDFPITTYQFKDIEVIVTHSTNRVAAIRPLTPDLRTPLGLQLGMSREAAERLFPPGALNPPLGGEDPDTTAREAYSCGPKGSTVLLQFDARSTVSRFVLYGFYGGP